MNTQFRQRFPVAAFAIVSALGTMGSFPAFAGNDPACVGEDQGICDSLGVMINARGRGCYRMLSVEPTGRDGYRITCITSSTDSRRVTYTLQFSADRTSYTLY